MLIHWTPASGEIFNHFNFFFPTSGSVLIKNAFNPIYIIRPLDPLWVCHGIPKHTLSSRGLRKGVCGYAVRPLGMPLEPQLGNHRARKPTPYPLCRPTIGSITIYIIRPLDPPGGYNVAPTHTLISQEDR